jgi:hypothetical protein
MNRRFNKVRAGSENGLKKQKRPFHIPAVKVRTAAASAAAMIGISLLAAGVKVVFLGEKVIPERESQVWNLEAKISIQGGEGGGRAILRVPLDERGQTVVEERMLSLGHPYSFTQSSSGRTMEIPADAGRSIKAVYKALIKLSGRTPIKPDEGEDPGAWSSPRFDPASEEGAVVRQLAASLEGADGSPEAAASILHYIIENFDVEDQPAEGDQAEWEAREAKLVFHMDLARSKGIPSRRVTGFLPQREGTVDPVSWPELFVNGAWVMSVPELAKAGRPSDEAIVLFRDEGAAALSRGLKRLNVTYRLWRDVYAPQFAPESGARAAGMSALERLPADTQKVIRVLLVVPLAALLVVAARMLLGVETVGTFLPVILALSFRNTELLPGLVMLTLVLVVGMAAMALFRRLGLPRVPSSALMVSIVVVILAYLSLAGELLDVYRLGNIAYFPIVIMTLLVERIGRQYVDKGLLPMFRIYIGTVAVSSLSYLVISVGYLQNLFLRFPELILAVMGLVVLAACLARILADGRKGLSENNSV